jgi:hypothetical protein
LRGQSWSICITNLDGYIWACGLDGYIWTSNNITLTDVTKNTRYHEFIQELQDVSQCIYCGNWISVVWLTYACCQYFDNNEFDNYFCHQINWSRVYYTDYSGQSMVFLDHFVLIVRGLYWSLMWSLNYVMYAPLSWNTNVMRCS